MCLAIVPVCIEIVRQFRRVLKILLLYNFHATVCQHPFKSPREQWGENLRNNLEKRI